jgi:hypothetical protein
MLFYLFIIIPILAIVVIAIYFLAINKYPQHGENTFLGLASQILTGESK